MPKRLSALPRPQTALALAAAHPLGGPALSWAVSVASGLVLLSSAAVGQTLAAPARAGLADPMRPPPGMPWSSKPGSAMAPSGLALPGLQAPTAAAVPMLAAPPTAPASRPAPPEKPRLQALHLPREGEPSAMVDGRIVRIGERIGAYTLAEIDPDGIVLRGAKGTERWNLLAPEPRRAPAEAPRDTPRETPDTAPPGGPATHVAGRKEN